jgi:hypothetical protein
MDPWASGPMPAMNQWRQWASVCWALLIAAATVGAQQKPNFSGTWVAISPAEAAGQEQEVRHTDTTLSTGHASEGGGHSATYKLDGSESRNELSSHGQKIVTLSKAEWSGDKLTITSSTTYPDGRKLDSRETWSMNSSGQLTIEMTQTMTGQPAQSMTLVHRKK